MRYLFSKTQEHTKVARREYISEALNLFFFEKGESDGFIELDGFPIGYLDVFFIVGHVFEVNKYLEKNIDRIEERSIVAITCFPESLKRFSGQKTIYVSKHESGFTTKYCGSKWGFDFDITESELNFYNYRSNNIIKKIENSMVKL